MVSMTKSKMLPMLIDMMVTKKREYRTTSRMKIFDGLVWVDNRVTEKLERRQSLRFVFLTAKTQFSQTRLSTFTGNFLIKKFRFVSLICSVSMRSWYARWDNF